jgi:hypothetical protein
MQSMAANSDISISHEAIVLKVLGGHRSGHVRGKGCGAIPTRLNSSSTHNQHNHDECLAKQLDTEKKLAEVLETQVAMQTEMNESRAAWQIEINESRAAQIAMQAQLERVLKHIGG